MKYWALIAALLIVVGCASNPNKIEAAYVSPLKYQNYDCDQIGLEQSHVERRTNDLYHSLKKEADKDAAQMGVGLLIFWPTLFFLEGGDGPEAAEYAQLKGEYNALRTVSVEKKCELNFSKDLEEIITEEPEEDTESSPVDDPTLR